MEDPTNYRRKYKAAIERAKEELGSGCFNKGSIEYIFPELKESEDEDERIRKEIISALKWANHKGVYDKHIAWLEKQGEKPITIGKRQLTGKAKELYENLDEKSLEETKKKMLAETAPKFKVGNWYQCTKDFFGKGVTFDKDTAYYCAKEGCLQNQYGCHIAIVKELYDYFKLWTIQDANDGDVLQLGKVTAIFKKYIGNGNCKCYCSVYDGEFEIPNTDNSYGCHNAVPATKEQRDILFQKMHKAGYEWDDEKKETKLLISNGGDFEPELSHHEVTEKSEQEVLTEKDIKMINILCSIFEVSNGYYKVDKPGQYAIRAEEILDWLKSFKRKLQ